LKRDRDRAGQVEWTFQGFAANFRPLLKSVAVVLRWGCVRVRVREVFVVRVVREGCVLRFDVCGR
jgi:hypothetical protein